MLQTLVKSVVTLPHSSHCVLKLSLQYQQKQIELYAVLFSCKIALHEREIVPLVKE